MRCSARSGRPSSLDNSTSRSASAAGDMSSSTGDSSRRRCSIARGMPSTEESEASCCGDARPVCAGRCVCVCVLVGRVCCVGCALVCVCRGRGGGRRRLGGHPSPRGRHVCMRCVVSFHAHAQCQQSRRRHCPTAPSPPCRPSMRPPIAPRVTARQLRTMGRASWPVCAPVSRSPAGARLRLLRHLPRPLQRWHDHAGHARGQLCRACGDRAVPCKAGWWEGSCRRMQGAVQAGRICTACPTAESRSAAHLSTAPWRPRCQERPACAARALKEPERAPTGLSVR
jgi:hypothetical protein